MENEKNRIDEVFNNWYYSGISSTNKKNPIPKNVELQLFNEFLKWSKIAGALIVLGYKNINSYKILDAGCGNGNALRKIIELGARPENCYGIDVSTDVVEFAKYSSPKDVNYQAGFIDKMNYDTDSFDIILNFGVLIHIMDNDHIKEIGKEFNRVLRKNGLLLVIVSDETMEWGEGMSHTTRNFNFQENELGTLFSDFELAATINCYSDHYHWYSPDLTFGLILQLNDLNLLNYPFKLAIFKSKK